MSVCARSTSRLHARCGLERMRAAAAAPVSDGRAALTSTLAHRAHARPSHAYRRRLPLHMLYIRLAFLVGPDRQPMRAALQLDAHAGPGGSEKQLSAEGKQLGRRPRPTSESVDRLSVSSRRRPAALRRCSRCRVRRACAGAGTRNVSLRVACTREREEILSTRLVPAVSRAIGPCLQAG